MTTNKHRIQTFVESSILEQLKFKAESENRSIASIVESVLISYFSGSNTTDIGTMLNQINNKLDRLFNHQSSVTSESLNEENDDDDIHSFFKLAPDCDFSKRPDLKEFEGKILKLHTMGNKAIKLSYKERVISVFKDQVIPITQYDDEIVEAYAPIVEAEEIEITQSESPKIHYFGNYFMAWEFSQAVKAEIVFTSERRAKKYLKFLTTLGRWEMSVIKGRPSFAPPHSKDAIPDTLTWKDDRIILSMWSMSHCPKDTAFKDLKRLSGYDFSLDPDKQN